MISKQLRTILYLLIIVAVLAAVVLLVMRLTDKDDSQIKLELLDGEAEGSSTKPRIMEELEENDIDTITLHNTDGTVTFVNDKQWEVTYISEYREYPLDSAAVDSLYSRVSSMIVTRIDLDPTDLSSYGLAENDDPAYVTVKKTDGTEHKVYFGYKTADNTAYYVMYDGRNVVYTLYNSNIEDVILAPVEKYISTFVAPELSELEHVNIQYINIRKNGKDFVSFEMVDEEYRSATGYLLTHKMTYPANYLINLTNFEKLLSSFVSLSGTEVVGFGYEANDDFSKLNNYGFDKGITEIEYSYSDIPTYLYVGGKTSDGTGYYVYSLLYDTLVVVPAESLPFIEWKLGDYIGETLFQMNIKYVETIDVISSEHNAHFELFGNEDAMESVKCNGVLLATDDNGDPQNFRSFYKNLIRLGWDGYADDKNTDSEPMLQIKIKTKFGEEYDYKFYQTSTLRCYFTYNGSGDFYTEKSTLDAFIQNLARVMNNEPVVLS